MNEQKPKLSEYLTIKEASELVGVHRDTLRRREKQDKLKSHRNPMNNYRLYKRSDLNRVLELAGESG